VTAKLLAFLRSAFAGIGAVGVILIALGFLFFAGEAREAVRGVCEAQGIGRVAKAACILIGAPERAGEAQTGKETPASKKADDLDVPTAPDRPANTPAKVAAKKPRPKDTGKLEREYGVDLDLDGMIDHRLPEIVGQKPAKPPEQATLLKEKEFTVRGRSTARVAALWLSSGSVDLRMAPADRWNWLHEVRYRVALDLGSSFRPNGSGELAIDWTPARFGPIYPTLGLYAARFDSNQGKLTDVGARLAIELHCSGLWRCKP